MVAARLFASRREAFCHPTEQFADRRFTFVTHVGDAEGGAFDFSIAAVDRYFVFLFQRGAKSRHVDTLVVFHADQRFDYAVQQ